MQTTLLQEKRERVRELEERTARALELKNQFQRELAQSQESPYEIALPDSRSGSIGISFKRPGKVSVDPELARQRVSTAHSDWGELSRDLAQARADLNSYEKKLRDLKEDLASLKEFSE